MKNGMKRIFSLLLALVLVMGMVPHMATEASAAGYQIGPYWITDVETITFD